MKSFDSTLIAIAATLIATVSAAAQEPTKAVATAPAESDAPPTIASISPPAATLGATTEWRIAGANLASVTEWIISGDGVTIIEAKPTAALATLKVKVDPAAASGYREVRALGPAGISNFALIRIDRQPLKAEVEPNDEPAKATPIDPGVAAWGVIKPQDIDYYRIAGKAGRRVTIDLEAQRLGTPITPVLTVTNDKGAALAQARETRGTKHDARLAFTFPADGDYLIQVRDNVYAGGDTAVYRLTVADTPFAAGMFPLGGPRGSKLELTLSGGSLAAPLSKTITLPDSPSAVIEPGPFDSPDGAVLSPMKLVAGDGPEITENAADSSNNSTTPIRSGETANGRISAPDEVDRYTFEAKKGSPIAIRIRASDLGSELDSVVTVRDSKGEVLAENDDAGGAAVQRGGFAINQTALPPDSRVVVDPKADGPITIEVADRYNDGGPAHAYRLEVGPSRPDFSVSLIFGNPAANNQGFGQRPRRVTTPGSNGALNLKPFQTVPINFLITAEGSTGPITVRAVGLPLGVTAEPKTIRPVLSRTGRASADAMFLKVAPEAAGVLGELHLVATAQPEGSPPIVREATATIAIDSPLPGSVANRPVMRTIVGLPLKVMGKPGEIATAPGSVATEFQGLTVPGVLLQGAMLDVDSGVTNTEGPAKNQIVAAKIDGTGVIAALVPGPAQRGRMIRLLADKDAQAGVRTLTADYVANGEEISRTVTVIVRPPCTVRARDEPIVLAKGQAATLWVGVTRESGFDGPVELKLDLPEGMRAVGTTVITADQSGLAVRLEGVVPPGQAHAVRVEGIARMPRGEVRVESSIRPMISGPPTEKGG